MILHSSFNEVRILVEAGIAVLLTGEKGSGKTTVVEQVAEELKLTFFSISMTRQTTLSHLLGFMNVNGVYIPSQLYIAVTEGGLFLLDEIDAGDPNVILCLNTIENGYISFPGGVVKLHPDFRLVATSNPQDKHHEYVGRTKLDAATLDRFDEIDVELDSTLEQSLVDTDVYRNIMIMRRILEENNSSITVSMRDSIRYQKRKDLDLLEGFMLKLSGKNPLVYEKYESVIGELPRYNKQEECKTVNELFTLIKSKQA